MASPADPALCGACGHLVEPGALRCWHCGVPFAGPRRAPVERVTIEETTDGVGAAIRLEDLDLTPED